MKTKAFIKKLCILSFCGCLVLIISCRSEQQDTITENTNGIAFNIDVNNFGENHTNEQANTKAAPGKDSTVSKQKFKSGPFSITSELSADKAGLTTNSAISPRSFTSSNVKIRIVAYISETGEYADQLVTTVAGSKQKLFNLSGGRKYTFVTYSFNNTVDPPQAPVTNLNQAKLNITSLNGNEAGTDLLYAVNTDVMLSGGNTAINVNLRHIFSRISIMVDDSNATGTIGQPGYVKGSYPLDNNTTGGFTGVIQDYYTSGNLNLKNASITEGVNSGLSVSGITTTAKTLIINTGSEDVYRSKLLIPAGAVTIGNDINTDPVSIAINGLNDGGLRPGTSYVLKLKFNSDRYVDGTGVTKPKDLARYAVIGGYRWDRFNVGVTNNIPSAANNPDEIRKEIHGAKYMFGAATDEFQHYVSQADDATNSSIPSSLWTGSPLSNWNSGGNNAPTKEPTDPCDPGYRVATSKEYDDLLSLTIKAYSGSSGSNNTYGRRLYSSRSHDVQLVFPAAGFRGAPTGSIPGGIVSRGINIMYWTSTGTFNGSTTASGIVTNGFPVRCIQE